MDHNSFLVWWLLAVPVVLAIVDRMMISGGKTSGAVLTRAAGSEGLTGIGGSTAPRPR